MSKVSEMSQALDELAAAADSLLKVTSLLREIFSAAVPASDPQPEEEAAPAKTYTFAEVRKAFSAKSHEGFTDQVRALITRYGADKLSGVSESDYPALMADLEAIG
jgi:hypothetical protein